MPMVSPRHSVAVVHALLYHSPFAFLAYYKGVKVDLEPILNGVVIDFSRKTAVLDELGAVQPGALCQLCKFARCLTRVPAFSAAYKDSKLIEFWIDGTFQRSHYRSRDARGMPVHSKHAAQGLEPHGVAHSGEQGAASIVHNNGLQNRSSQATHAVGQPGRN